MQQQGESISVTDCGHKPKETPQVVDENLFKLG